MRICMSCNCICFVVIIGNDDWKHEPFDFLIQNELVRMSLEEFLLAMGISAVYFFFPACLNSLLVLSISIGVYD